MKLLYAITAFALFPLAAPAQTLDSSLLTAMCHADYSEDSGGQCSAIYTGEVVTIEAILERYGAVVTRDADEQITGAFLSDPDEMPVGAITLPSEIPVAEHAILTDENSGTDPAIELDTIASRIVAPEKPQLETNADGADEIEVTGPTVRLNIPAVTTEPVDDNPAAE